MGPDSSRIFSNRLTRLLQIDVPIIAGGMVWVSGWRLAAAVSQGGGLGLIGAGSMTSELLEQHLQRARQATTRPVGVNIPLMNRHAEGHIDVCIRHRVPVVVTAAGNPALFTERLKSAGITVMHVVPNARLAKKAQACGCDAVVAEGTEAGGHNGRDHLTSLVLWPSVVDAVTLPVIGAGGVIDGRGMAAAFALGCEGVQVGTRFAVTHESSASDAYKQACVEAAEGQSVLFMRDETPVRALHNAYVREMLERERAGAGAEILREFRGRERAKKGIFEGDLEAGELEAGQAVGSIHAVMSAIDVIEEMVRDFGNAAARFDSGNGREEKPQ